MLLAKLIFVWHTGYQKGRWHGVCKGAAYMNAKDACLHGLTYWQNKLYILQDSDHERGALSRDSVADS